MSDHLREQGTLTERARVLMTLSHPEAFRQFDIARHLIAIGAPSEAAQLTLGRLLADPYPVRESGIQAERGRVLHILDHPKARQCPALAFTLIESGADKESADRAFAKL